MSRHVLIGLSLVAFGCNADTASSPEFGGDTETTTTGASADAGVSTGGEASTSTTADSDSGSEGSSGDSEATGDDDPGPSSVEDDEYEVPQNALPLVVSPEAGVVDNDVSIANAQADVIETSRGGMVTLETDGSFEYEPPPWVWGEDDFDYTAVGEDGVEHVAQVRILVRPTEIDLQHLATGENGFRLDGEDTGDNAGSAVAGGADVDGDGTDDLLIGAFAADGAGGGASGRTYVMYGDPDGTPGFLASATNGSGGFAADGEATGDLSGEAADFAGDVNGDGIIDVVIGARGSDAGGSDSGRAYVVWGNPPDSPVLLTDVVGGTNGFVIEAEMAGDLCGLSVAGAGDVNDDGLADVIIGAPYGPDHDEFGRAYIVYGKANNDPVLLADVVAGTGGFAILGEEDGDRSAFSVAGVGDVDGDGHADVAIGALRADPGGLSSGRAYVVYGKADGASVSLLDVVAGTGGFAIDGATSQARTGISVAAAGDVNGDGTPDVAVGAPGLQADAGAGYVIFGRVYDEPIDLASLTAAQGFRIDGEPGSEAGTAIAGAGDVNGDGRDDIVIGAPEDSGNGDAAGRAFVVYGKADGLPVYLGGLASGDGLAGFAINGIEAGNRTGNAVSTGGDGGDGFADIIIGSRGASSAGSSAGEVYFVRGNRTEW